MASRKQKAKPAKSPRSKTTPRKSARKTAPKTARKAAKSARPAAPKSAPGTIAHTEFASSDPAATKAWAEKALGWKFMPPMPSPAGEYHMWQAGTADSGGIRGNMPPEMPGTIAYVEVANIDSSFQKALDAGAKAMLPPEAIGGGMGRMAIVKAPGGVAIGLWAAK